MEVIKLSIDGFVPIKQKKYIYLLNYKILELN